MVSIVKITSFFIGKEVILCEGNIKISFNCKQKIIPKGRLDSNCFKALKNKETCARKFGGALKNRLGRKITFELKIIIKKTRT